ncbi:MAG: hypothetical protein ACLUEK_13530 [Oscillospiraceae bacterium]
MIPADKRIERLTQVARMYYEQNMNQSEIAKAIGVSRPLVSVLLAEARECGIVTITINSVESARELLARRLEARFGLRLAEVVEDAKSAEDTNNLVAARAYELCFSGDARPGSVGPAGPMLGRMADYAEGPPDLPAKPATASFPSSAASAPPTAATTPTNWPG